MGRRFFLAKIVPYKDKTRERTWALAHPEKIKANAKKWRMANKELAAARAKASIQKNPEKYKAYAKAYTLENKEKLKANKSPDIRRAARRGYVFQATPKWCDKKAIKAVYAKARSLTNRDDIDYEVDHIIPLRGKNVCGLHVARNLRIVFPGFNKSKNNKFDGVSHGTLNQQ